MKTLVIAYRYPLPESSGDKIRTMNFVRYFKKRGRVDILYYEPLEHGVKTGAPFDSSLHVDVYEDKVGKTRLSYLYDKLKYSKPWALGDFSESGIKEIVRVVENGNYDYLLCRNALCALPLFYLSKKDKKRVILDIDDIMTRELYRSSDESDDKKNAWRNVKKNIDYQLYRRFQINCARLGKALICSEKDRKQISGHIDANKLHVVPNIPSELELTTGYMKNGHQNLDTILFVGHLSYTPNVQGIIWFVNEIYSRMISGGEQIKLIVAGKNPDPQLAALCSRYAQINLVDSPPDVLPFYDKCGVVIVPLLAGGGTRIKILEAGYALRPVITTRIGGYGLNLTDYEHILSFDDYHSFTEKLEWLKEAGNYEQIVNNMSRYVTSNYSINSFENAMDEVLRQ